MGKSYGCHTISHIIITLRACARGKEIGHVRLLAQKNTTYPDPGHSISAEYLQVFFFVVC